MENDVFPWLGKRPIADITAMEILSVLRRIDARGARYTAHRVRSEISHAFRFAVVTGRAERDPCPDLQGAIAPAKAENFPAITEPREAAALLRAVDAFQGTFTVKSALLLAPMLFVRPGELRKAEWKDINLEKGEWKYLVTKTKADHLVPLATQAIAILTELHALTGRCRWVFPGRDPQTCLALSTRRPRQTNVPPALTPTFLNRTVARFKRFPEKWIRWCRRARSRFLLSARSVLDRH